MKFFFLYLRQRLKIVGIFALFSAVFASVFMLYHIDAKAVFYPCLVCGFAGAVIFVFDFIKVRKKHIFLCNIKNLSASLITSLPNAVSVDDKDYQQIIENLIEEQKAFENSTEIRYYDMVSYYTVWAHQIKTPISSMRLTLQKEDSLFSRKLSRELFKIEQYVDMVLTFLRLGSDSTDFVIREYDLDEIIKQSVKKFAGEFIDRKLRLEYDAVSVKAVTDEKWISFVIEQILSNALKYTKEGAVKIYGKDGDIICIEDSGIGISPEDLPRVFENGYTGYNGRTDKKASGIGLYLCRNICGKLGHKISVESVLGQGTLVMIDFHREITVKE